MSKTPSDAEWRQHLQIIKFYKEECERRLALLRDCYRSGGLPPDLMRRIEALGVKE